MRNGTRSPATKSKVVSKDEFGPGHHTRVLGHAKDRRSVHTAYTRTNSCCQLYTVIALKPHRVSKHRLPTAEWQRVRPGR